MSAREVTWVPKVRAFVYKYTGDWTPEEIDQGDAREALYEVKEGRNNLLTIGGVSLLFQYALGNGTATGGQALTFLNNAQTVIGVGDSATAAADTQTDLQAATNKTFKAMDATYPQHTDTTGTAGSKTITYRSTYATGDANYAWNEWGIKNGAAGRLLNRKVEALGTKTSAATWQLSISISLA